jgi:hypothetical protein
MINVLIMMRGTVADSKTSVSTLAHSLSCRRSDQMGRRTPHDRPHARYQLYDLVLDAAVDVLAEAALI